MFQRLVTYIKETRTEMRQVNWPTRRETAVATAVVIGVSVALAAFLGALDFAFQSILKVIVS